MKMHESTQKRMEKTKPHWWNLCRRWLKKFIMNTQGEWYPSIKERNIYIYNYLIYIHTQIYTHIYLYIYRDIYIYLYIWGIERRCRLKGEKFIPSGGEVKETSCRGTIKLGFERLKGFCQVDKDGTFIPETENSMCNKMKARKRMSCILGITSNVVLLEHEVCWGVPKDEAKRQTGRKS